MWRSSSLLAAVLAIMMVPFLSGCVTTTHHDVASGWFSGAGEYRTEKSSQTVTIEAPRPVIDATGNPRDLLPIALIAENPLWSRTYWVAADGFVHRSDNGCMNGGATTCNVAGISFQEKPVPPPLGIGWPMLMRLPGWTEALEEAWEANLTMESSDAATRITANGPEKIAGSVHFGLSGLFVYDQNEMLPRSVEYKIGDGTRSYVRSGAGELGGPLPGPEAVPAPATTASSERSVLAPDADHQSFGREATFQGAWDSLLQEHPKVEAWLDGGCVVERHHSMNYPGKRAVEVYGPWTDTFAFTIVRSDGTARVAVVDYARGTAVRPGGYESAEPQPVDAAIPCSEAFPEPHQAHSLTMADAIHDELKVPGRLIRFTHDHSQAKLGFTTPAVGHHQGVLMYEPGESPDNASTAGTRTFVPYLVAFDLSTGRLRAVHTSFEHVSGFDDRTGFAWSRP